MFTSTSINLKLIYRFSLSFSYKESFVKFLPSISFDRICKLFQLKFQLKLLIVKNRSLNFFFRYQSILITHFDLLQCFNCKELFIKFVSLQIWSILIDTMVRLLLENTIYLIDWLQNSKKLTLIKQQLVNYNKTTFYYNEKY